MTEAQAIQAIAKSKATANRALKGLDIEKGERALKNLSASAKTLKERESQRAQRKKKLRLKNFNP